MLAERPTAYCTYFDRGYLSRALALIRSLRRHGDASPIWILAMDDDVDRFARALDDPSVHVVTLAELEDADPRLLGVKGSRSRMEYYFTCTAQLMRWVARRSPAGTGVAYLDADMAFFDAPARVFDALGDGSVGIIAHRYPDALAARLAKYGTYNVGWVGALADEEGLRCLDWWADRCIEWCSDTPDAGRYADQGYLDGFAAVTPALRVLPEAGFDLAPWNTGRHTLTVDDDDHVTVDGDPLTFFHFHGLRRRGSWWVSSQLVYRAPMGVVLRRRVYGAYAAALGEAERWLAGHGFTVAAPARRGVGLRGFAERSRRLVLDVLSIATGNAVRAAPGRVS
jgi:hypothetical protein